MTVVAINTVDHVGRVRAFNRFYTKLIGVLREGLLDTPYSLTEARVLYELAQREARDAADLRRSLDVDPAYLSRILARFETDGLVRRERSPEDGRRQVVVLTARGKAEFTVLDNRSAEEIRQLLDPLPAGDRRRLLGAMEAVRHILDPTKFSAPSIVLRGPYAGEFGWVVQRHGAIYWDEYGWDDTFEALVARIVADFVDRRDPRKEAARIAEVDGEPVGCIFCVRKDAVTAQLRLLLVEPRYRGLGLGQRLIQECLRFARQAKYERIMLWTNSVLDRARRLYERAGFRLADEEPHHSFGVDLVGQNWWREL